MTWAYMRVELERTRGISEDTSTSAVYVVMHFGECSQSFHLFSFLEPLTSVNFFIFHILCIIINMYYYVCNNIIHIIINMYLIIYVLLYNSNIILLLFYVSQTDRELAILLLLSLKHWHFECD